MISVIISFGIVSIAIFFFTVLIFIGVLSILAGTTAAALADDDDVDIGRSGGDRRFGGDRRVDGPVAVLEQDDSDPVATFVPKECQEPPADDLSLLMEAVAGTGPVRM